METTDFNLNVTEKNLDYNYPSSYEDNEIINTTYCIKCDEILQKISITLCSIVFALGIIGNGLVIWIAGFRMKRTVSAAWFLHLAIADFLCCASLPLRIIDWAHFFLMLSGVCCTLIIILFNLNMTTSVLLLTAMSIDRWVSVMWPFWAKVHRSYKLVRITVAIIWLLSLLLTGLLFFLNELYYLDLHEWCLFYMIDTHFVEIKQRIQLVRLLIMCVIPFLIIMTSYVTIFFKLRKSKRSQRSQRSSRIITAVISCFFICWFPYYIWPLTSMYDGDSVQFHAVNIFITTLAYLNSCINPIIYVFMGQDFQNGFFRSIPARIERTLTENMEHPNNLCKGRADFQNTCSTDV
ncbi:C3a anaphylatoxin chemotactic receptor-like [Anomaloglossus baeobatrachus]|uniref:C3a anaphylatoxin chemotactic receptor-like n=1 Tax=Anomaloglossus baeobatrachus TaxID=238106 RepID=UPI003F4F9E20